jgi:DNA mismatch endonuclease, patch repair protein
MTDIVDKATRSRMMGAIGGKNTAPELRVRRFLHAAGLRFRLHDRTLPGTPDIVLRKHRSVIFVHGCFWHQHIGCRFAYVPASNKPFWTAKFEATATRDLRAVHDLLAHGWRVHVIWECESSNPRALNRLAKTIAGTNRRSYSNKNHGVTRSGRGEPFQSAVGTIVRTRRKELGLTQEDIAHFAVVGKSMISQIERGLISVSPQLARAIARALKIDPSTLIHD